MKIKKHCSNPSPHSMATGCQTHTPTPWRADGRAIDSPRYEIAVCSLGLDEDENEMPLDEAEDNSNFIVRACNAHDELMALVKLVELYARINHPIKDGCELHRKIIKTIARIESAQ